jgi:hypothetical protein
LAKKRNGEFAGAAKFDRNNTYGQLSQRAHVCVGDVDRDKGLGPRWTYPDFLGKDS